MKGVENFIFVTKSKKSYDSVTKSDTVREISKNFADCIQPS